MFSCQFVYRWVCGSAIAAMLLITTPARAQFTAHAQTRNYSIVDESDEVPLQINQDVARPASATPMYHILPANTEAGRHAALTGPAEAVAAQGDLAVAPLAALAKPGFFPADLTNFGGGSIGSGSSVDIYYNCPGNNESCWGDPEGFLVNLSNSKFIHVVDQYVGLRTNKRYPLFDMFVFENGSITNFTQADVENAVELAAGLSGIGPNHIFHLFLPQGVDVCPETNSCYSPDNPSTFALCAYHSSTTSSGILYTVEPFQEVSGCVLHENSGGYPNGELADSTNSALSHETFELISDPFLDAWIAENSSPEAGNEMADICHGPGDGQGGTIVPTYTLVRGHNYQTQLEYSNFRHGCVVSP
jgi:hypothetical protein